MGTKTVNDAIKRARIGKHSRDGWGGNEEVALLSKMLGMCIVVHTKENGSNVQHVYNKGTWLDTENCCKSKVLHLTNEDGIHYEALA